MKVLVSERLSEHKYKTPEGYLICTDAILARTGKQTYTKDELFGDGDSTEVNVDRPYKEVFDASTLASFENKPVTIEHPDEEVNVGNYKDYAVGYVRDVHQGKTSDGQDVILGNIVITDQQAINDIEEGKHTNLSCGYDCDILGDDGSYFQHKIRGNHVALCECPRAGITKLQDSIDEMHKYKFEYNMPFYDRKTGESGYDHRSKVVSASTSYEAAMQLPDDAEIVRIYKDDKLLKSFTSKQAGQWHKAGNKEQLKGLDAMKKPSVKVVAREIFESLVDEGFSAKEVQDMIKKKDSFAWDKLARHDHTEYFDDDYEVDRFCKANKAQIFKELNDLFEEEAEMAFDDDELEEIGFFDSLDTINDAAKPSTEGINKVKEFLKPSFKIVSENMTSSGHYQMSVVSINEYNRYYYNMAFNRVYPLLSRIGSSYGMIVDPSFSLKEDKHVYGKIDIVSKNTTDSFKEEPKAWNDVKAALKNEFMLTREGKTLTDRHHMTFISLDMYNEHDFKDLSRTVYIKLKNIASKYGTPITHSIGLRKDFYVVLDVDIDKQYINDSKKLLNIINVYKLAKAVSDAKVVNEEDLDFIKQAKKIQKRGNPKQLFVVRVISNDYAEGFASGDGGKTWETAKTRLVKRAGGNSRYQTERRFGAIGNLSVEIPFSHISWCNANNATVIPNETIDHKDGNHLNDDPSNLEPASVKENSRRNAEFMKMR